MDLNTIGLDIGTCLLDKSCLVGLQFRHGMEIRGAAAWSKGLGSLIAIMPMGQQNIGAGVALFNNGWSRIRTLDSQ